jgi:peptidoglycan hydrolase-like protein with peptidoglycan-binding domain
MKPSWSVIAWLPWLLLTACVASPPPASTTGRERPAVDRLLTRGDIQVAEAHLHDFGFDPGPVDGVYTAQTRAAVRAFQARYGLPATGLLDYTTRLQLIPGLDFDKPDS